MVNIGYGILVLVLAILIVASTSIGIECYNKNAQKMKNVRSGRRNFEYLQFITTFGVLGILSGIGLIVYGVKGKYSTSPVNPKPGEL